VELHFVVTNLLLAAEKNRMKIILPLEEVTEGKRPCHVARNNSFHSTLKLSNRFLNPKGFFTLVSPLAVAKYHF